MLDSGRRAELTEQLYNRNATCSMFINYFLISSSFTYFVIVVKKGI